MELARLERELTKPINWGERIYHSLKQRETEVSQLNSLGLPPLSLNSNVRLALERYPTAVGELDATLVLSELNDDEQCLFFGQYPTVETIILQRWSYMSLGVLRTISITSGACLLELDFSFAKVTAQHLQVILIRTEQLAILRLNSTTAEVQCAKVISQLVGKSLRELHLNKCEKISTDALSWIGGTSGVAALSLARLRCLDLGQCPSVKDGGMLAVANGCHRLTFLNLENCAEVTDASIVQVAKSTPRMQLANFSGCALLTNKSVVAMGKSWKDLQSINLSRCPLITDKGVKALAAGCKNLQAVNIAGLLKVSEEAMFCLADQCPGLLTLNLTGCERITMNGVENLVAGLQYVVKAVTFLGFRPQDEHVERKLNQALKMVLSRESRALEAQRLLLAQQEEERRAAIHARENRCATIIQQYLFRYKCRMRFYHLWRQRVERASCLFIQRVYRGYRGRCRAQQRAVEVNDFRSKSPYALLLQKCIRAFLCRRKQPVVSKRVRELYLLRRREVESAIVVRLQAQARRFLSKKRVLAWLELRAHQRLNLRDAILVMQKLARKFLASLCVRRKRNAKNKQDEARFAAGMKIKIFCVEGMARYKARLSGEALRNFYRKKWTAAIDIQRFFRGFVIRERVQRLRIRLATEYYAAREIQRIYRGAMVLHWRDMRSNVIAAFVLDRHYVERRDALALARKRYSVFKAENMQDSASEPDDEDWNELTDFQAWVKEWDAKKKRPYWQNHLTNQITYDEPQRPLAHELGLLQKRIRVYWVVQAAWYEGTIVRYHKRKARHRVDYDDGDHEWVDCEKECERIQIQQPDGSWVMYLMYQSEEKLDELRKAREKLEADDYKARAFRDANQWKSFTDDTTGDVMFLSQITGELRSGAPFALDWGIQDDGFGFPCFANRVTGAVVYEDPRFTYDVQDDVLQQRKYVMQELRYAIYVCKALWEEYQDILSINDTHSMHRILMKVRNCPKVLHLHAFLLRAQALYQPTSIVDKPTDQAIAEELQYAQWLSHRIAEVQQKAEDMLLARRDNKHKVVEKLTEKSGMVVYCRNCGRQTKRHLEFCATCGKPQLFFDTIPRTKSTSQLSSTPASPTPLPTPDTRGLSRTFSRATVDPSEDHSAPSRGTSNLDLIERDIDVIE